MCLNGFPNSCFLCRHITETFSLISGVNHPGVFYLHCNYKDHNHFSFVLYIFSVHSFISYSIFRWVAEQWCSHSPTTSRLNFLGLPQRMSPALFRAISNTCASSIVILSIFNEQSPSTIRPKSVIRPWKSLLVWPWSSLLKTVTRRGKNRLPSLKLSRMLTIAFFAFLWTWGAGGLKEQGTMTQEPTRAWIRSGTNGAGARVWTPLHKAAVVTKIRKSITTQGKGSYAVCWILCYGIKLWK